MSAYRSLRSRLGKYATTVIRNDGNTRQPTEPRPQGAVGNFVVTKQDEGPGRKLHLIVRR